ncbi:MAG: WecB/TagA/CpsF family glycosyltransferase [bacterium]
MGSSILGVKIDDKSEKDFLQIIEERLKRGERTFIATPNPEMLILAEKDRGFASILNNANLCIPDGSGLKLGAKIFGWELKNRVAGTDLMDKICGLSELQNFSIYFLGAMTDVARDAAANIKKKYPGLKIAGAESGGKLEEWNDRVIVEHINAVHPDILFVALGHGKQERWIFENFDKLKSVKLAMGIGGAFDFFAGRVPRAPKWMRNIGLEWLRRLFYEPWRYKRIWNAVIVFPWMCWVNRRNTLLR